MGNRLSKIYTRTGDDGTTALACGTRLSKSHLRFDVMGKIDLINSHIGLIGSCLQADNCHTFDVQLSRLQHQLFNLGGELAMPAWQGILPEYVAILESDIDAWNDKLPYLKDFILPAGSMATSYVHVARCLVRDGERLLVALHEQDGNVSAVSLQFMNRLSDWLFVFARIVARLQGGQEVLWDKACLQ